MTTQTRLKLLYWASDKGSGIAHQAWGPLQMSQRALHLSESHLLYFCLDHHVHLSTWGRFAQVFTLCSEDDNERSGGWGEVGGEGFVKPGVWLSSHAFCSGKPSGDTWVHSFT